MVYVNMAKHRVRKIKFQKTFSMHHLYHTLYNIKEKIWVLQFSIQNILVLDILHSFFFYSYGNRWKDSYICSCSNHFIKYQNSSSYKVSREV